MLRIALPNKGRLSEDARDLFNQAGLDVLVRGDRALTASLGGEFEAIFVRAQDVPEFIDPLDGLGWRSAIVEYTAPESPRRAAQMERLVGWQPPNWTAHFERISKWLD